MLLQPPPPGATEPRPSVAQCGAPLELYHRPRNLFVAGFLGSPRMNFLPATVRSRGADGAVLALQDGTELTLPVQADRLRDGESVTIGVRSEHLRPAGNVDARLSAPMRTAVQWLEHLGDQSLAYLQGPGGPLVLRLPEGHAAPSIGDSLPVSALVAQTHVFDAQGEAVPAIGERRASC